MIASFDFCRLNLQVFVTKWHGGVSRVLIGDGGMFPTTRESLFKVVDGDMLNGRRRMRYRVVTAYLKLD